MKRHTSAGAILPDDADIKIRRIGENVFELDYSETFLTVETPDDNTETPDDNIDLAIQNSVRAIDSMRESVKDVPDCSISEPVVTRSDRGITVRVVYTGSRTVVAGGVLGEFGAWLSADVSKRLLGYLGLSGPAEIAERCGLPAFLDLTRNEVHHAPRRRSARAQRRSSTRR